jgi:class 3 adenylate cyclase/tetratricopeptide (TPR) repeat protein
VECSLCQASVRDDSTFCTVCGGQLLLACIRCHAHAQPEDQYCGRCGTRLLRESPQMLCAPAGRTALPAPALSRTPSRSSRSMPDPERKHVTVLFADISGFTAMSEKMDPEEVTDMMNGCLKMLAEIVLRYDGYVDKFIGDCIMAVFGAPVAHENDPELAIRSALDMKREMIDYNRKFGARLEKPLSLHIGVNSGVVIAGGVGYEKKMDYTVMGDTVNLASRMESTAGHGQIFISMYTYNLVRQVFDVVPHGAVHVKGKQEPVMVYEVIKEKSSASEEDNRAGMSVPLIGRTQEIQTLLDCLDRVVRKRHGEVVFLVSEPGIGKSRLQMEIKQHIRERTLQVLEGICRSFSQSTSYYIFSTISSTLFDIESEDLEDDMIEKMRATLPLLTHTDLPLSDEAVEALVFIGLAIGIRPEKLEKAYGVALKAMDAQDIKVATFRAFAWFFRQIARINPFVLIIEDIHYADAISIELVEYIFDSLADAPIMLLLLMRPVHGHPSSKLPEIARRSLGSHAHEIHFKRLTAEESDQMVRYLLKTDHVPGEIFRLVQARSDGNPMYIEETVRSLVEDGVIRVDEQGGIHIIKDLDQVAIPTSLQGMIIARIDRLPNELKDLLHAAAVIGPTFKAALIRRVAPHASMDERLGRLVEMGILFESKTFPEVEYSFRNVLSQEAIYSTLLHKKLKELHAVVAQQIEALYPNRLEEYYEALARHYQRANEVDKAFHYTLRSAFKAKQSYANADAESCFVQAIDLGKRLTTPPKTFESVYIALSEVQELNGAMESAIRSLQEALAIVRQPLMQGDILRNIGRIHEKSGRSTEALDSYRQAEALLENAPNSVEMGMLLMNRSWILNRVRQTEEAVLQANRAMEIFEMHGDWERIALVSNNLGVFLEHQGHFEEALECNRKSLQIFSDLGNRRQVANLYMSLGFLHDKIYQEQRTEAADNRQLDEALDYFTRSYEIMHRIGNLYGSGTALMSQGRVLMMLGRHDDAERVLLEALRIHNKLDVGRKILANEWALVELYMARQDLTSARSHLAAARSRASSPADQDRVSRMETRLASLEEGQS